ncbi:MAG: tail fiber protein [Bacteroidia bacterium]
MDPTLAEIRIFAGNFAPLSWAFCNGALMSIAENTALFSLLGTIYGGDGQTTFALPDFRGRIAVGTGQGPGLSSYDLGQVSGSETVTLLTTNLPFHTHSATGTVTPKAQISAAGTQNTPGGAYYSVSNTDMYASGHNNVGAGTPFNFSLGVTGGSQPHENLMPYLSMYYIIAVEGIYPSRN